MDCKNYRTIALMSHLSKVLMSILLERLKSQTEEHLSDEQAGFRRDRSTVQQILALRLIAEKARRKGKKVYNCFIDFQKAFDSVDQQVVWAVLESYGVDIQLVALLKDINEKAEAAVRVGRDIGSWFKTNRGTRQGDPISPRIFITDLERVMDRIAVEGRGITIQGMDINNLRFADDIDILENSAVELEKTVQELSTEGKRYGLLLNIDKTKTMVLGQQQVERRISVDGLSLENVEKFTYLGSMITHDLDCMAEIMIRIAKATTNLEGLKTIWKSKAITLKTKLEVLNTCVFSSMLYGCEAWVLTKEIQRRILAFERKCYRKMLQISWTQKVTNEQLYDRIKPKENILQKVIKRKLRLFGHICRMDNARKLKTLVFGEMEGDNKRGRPHREWLDDIKDWCHGSVQELGHIALDRNRWNKVVKEASDTNGHWSHGS